ncbi:MAG TPA: type II/IV secretion system ATPase subunit [Candidatus Thermoplasmatota archaeon]|nr:type II/IV secretion system ATPase subunit [Candidatus Thermoplasmatota archaeon]
MDLKEAVAKNPHLGAYLEAFKAQTGTTPDFHQTLSRSLKDLDMINVLYPVGDPIFIHIYDTPDRKRKYVAIEPALTPEEKVKYKQIKDLILRLAPFEASPGGEDDLRKTLKKLYQKAVIVEGTGAAWNPAARLLTRLNTKVQVTKQEHEKLEYFLVRNIVDHGPIEPIMRDPYMEDISSIGCDPIFVVHKLFDTVQTNVRFQDERELDDWIRNMSERMGRPVSESRPIVDATLPDGSRINVVYSSDVSAKGPSFTIRKFSDTPTSITQIIRFGTMSVQVAAYLWLALENHQSIFVCGETASGKTTSLNGMLAFVKPKDKMFTAEDTPEVRPPQPLWQQLVTRESGPEEGRVTMFDLLKAALRSRPNYIIVGEIRGAEGNVAFQAMQTGHPVIATFHASSVGKMIQRFTSNPINVPITFMDNLNISLIQMAVYNKGKMLRRVLAVEEIEGYNEQAGGVLTRAVFKWDPVKDKHVFRGRNNSYILETKIAERIGLPDKRMIYEELDLRAKILERMIELGIFDYYEVNRIIANYYDTGVKGLPFKL